MLSGCRFGSSLFFLVLGAGCSTQSSTPDMETDVVVTQGVDPASAGIAGKPAMRSAAGVTSSAPVGTSGASGSAGTVPPLTAAAGRSGSPTRAGSGGLPANMGDVAAGSGAGAGGMSLGTAGTSGAAGMSSEASTCTVAPISDEMRRQYKNMDEPYYTKYASANGVIVATGPKVADEAVIRYCEFIKEMVSNQEIHDAMLDDKMWFTMIDEDEQLSSLPQIERAYGTSLNQRARGLGSLTPTICAEDSIMCSPRDRWKGDCICPHEAGHTLYSSGIAKVPELSRRLTEITQETRSSGRLSNAYVWMDGNESGMMAWGIQVWYDCAINGNMGAYHSDINTRAELEKELPELHQFLSEILPTDNKYEDCYAKP